MGRTADVLAAAAAIVLGFLLLAFRDRYAADQVRLVDRLGVRAPGGEPLQRFLAAMLDVLLAVFGAFMIIRGRVAREHACILGTYLPSSLARLVGLRPGLLAAQDRAIGRPMG